MSADNPLPPKRSAGRTPTTGGHPGTRADSGGDPAVRLRMAVSRISRRLRNEGAGGLTQSQVSALTTLWAAGQIRIGDLAELEGVAGPTMTRCVAALDDSGYITRADDPADARSVRIVVSAKGSRLLDRIRRDRTAKLAVALDALDQHDFDLLVAALPALERLAGLEPKR